VKYANFKFVDFAVEGAKKRNHVVDLTKLSVSEDATDTYTTMFRFKEEYYVHVHGSDGKKANPTVRGANQFECWSDYLWFDIDAEDLQDATISMQTLLRGIKSMGLSRYTVVFFSGSKGYHVGVNAGVFGFKPSQTLPQDMKGVATHLASSFGVEIDGSIYNHNRLWRVVDTLHRKTGLRKTKITVTDALQLSLDAIKKLAATERKLKSRYVMCGDVSPMYSMVQLKERVSTGNKTNHNSSWEPASLTDERRDAIQVGLNYLLANGIIYDTKKAGPGRDNEALLRASECRKLGMPKSECLSKVLEWNTLNDPPLYVGDVERVVDSAYTGDGYDFSPNSTPTLRIARENGVSESTTCESSPSPDEEHSVIGLGELPQSLKDRFKIKSDVEYVEGIDWADYQNTPDVEPPESLTPFHTVQVGRQNLLWCEDKGGKGTMMSSEIKWLLANTEYRIMIFNSDEPRGDLGARMERMNIPYTPKRVSIVDNAESWEQIVANIAVFQPHVVYFDALTSILEKLAADGVPDGGDDRSWTRIMTDFEFLVTAFNTPTHKMGVCICHHSTKNSKDKAGNKTGGKVYRGNLMIAARCSTRIEVRLHKDRNETVLVYTGRHPRNPLTLKYVNSVYVAAGTSISDTQDESVVYSIKTITALSTLMAHLPSLARPRLQKLTGLSSAMLTNIRNQQDIRYKMENRREVWYPTAEQVKEWKTNGVKTAAPIGNVRDVINGTADDSEDKSE